MPHRPLPDTLLAEALSIAGVACWHPAAHSDRQASDNLKDVLGCPASAVPTSVDDWLRLVHADDYTALSGLLKTLNNPSPTESQQATLRLRHGAGFWRSYQMRVGHTSAGTGLLTLSDVTEQKQLESAARDSQLRYRALYNTTPLAFILWDRQGHIAEWNHRAETLFGWPAAKVIGQRVHRLLLPEENRASFSQCITHLIQGHNDGQYRGQAKHADGRTLTCNWYNVALRNHSGTLIGILSLVLDVSEEHFAKRELENHQLNLAQLVQARTGELAQARDALAQIIDGNPVPTFVLDKEHRITHWNKACEQIIGARADEMVGTRNQWQAFYPSPRPVMADLVIDGQMNSIAELYAARYRSSDVVDGGFEAEDYFPGFGRWLFFTAAPLYNAEGEIVGAIETLQDITPRKQTEIALQAAKQVAESAANAKSQFMANMSHEIRTPMNAVIGLANLLLKTELNTRQRDFASRIHGAGQMLLGLINDILDFSKIEAGQMSLEQIEFALDDVLENVTTIVVQRAQEKGLEIHYVLEPELPQHFIGDPLRLTQILINLIGNAVKFTARGAVTAFFRCSPAVDRVQTLEVDIQDSGIGMTESQLENLFQAFTQADTSITRKYGGTGLGLTICKRLSQLMGGDIWVNSSPAVGSTFSFKVQLGQSSAIIATPSGIGKRALVVDDNPLARNVLAALLKKTGYQVLTAEAGEQALDRLENDTAHGIELITLDLNMPGIDGLELAEILRQRDPQQRLKLVLVTASDSQALADDPRLAHFNGILQKPVTAAQLNRLLSHEQASSPMKTIAPLAGLRVLLVEDIPTNQLVARELLEALGVTVAIANNGREALDNIARNHGHYDLVLMDIQMPEMDGLEATRRLRADPAIGTQLPIIAMTAHALDEERQRCAAAGMNDFITKPIDPSLLQDTLSRWQSARTQAIPETPPAPAASPILPELPGIDCAEGLRRMMNKPALYRKVLHDFHQRFAGEGRAIRQALLVNNREEAERRAHSCKGLAGTIGAGDLQHTAYELEQALRESAIDAEKQLQDFETALQIVIAGIGIGLQNDPSG